MKPMLTVTFLFCFAASVPSGYRASAPCDLRRAPATSPEKNQKSIDEAIRMFCIRIPSAVHGPFYAESESDRGKIVASAYGLGIRHVQVGPAAFSSWGILGSTLAHETEGHARQPFLWKTVLNALVPQMGTRIFERAAYQIEIDQAERFGLSEEEAHGIRSTMEFLYPAPQVADVLHARVVWALLLGLILGVVAYVFVKK